MFTLLREFRVVSILWVGCGVLAVLGCGDRRTADTPPEPEQDVAKAAVRVPDTDAVLRQAAPSDDKETIRYSAPEGWSPAEISGLQRAAFGIQDGDLSAEVTVMSMSGSATRLLPNVNLWRRQVGLGDTTQEELDSALQPIEIGGRSAHYMLLIGPAESERPVGMLAALISSQDRTWFFKMLGDVELVQRQKDRFEEFLRSVTFVPVGGDENE